MRKAALTLALLAGAPVLGAPPPAPYSWSSAPMGGGGFVDGFVYHPAVPGLLYARTDIGGAYRRDGQDERWVPITDGMPDQRDLGILSLAVDPRDAGKVYLATGLYTGPDQPHGTLWRSADRGRSWARADLPVRLGGNEDGRGTGERLQVDPALGRILVLGTSHDGLLISRDGAKSWADVPAFPHVATSFTLFAPGTAPGRASQTLLVGTLDKAHPLYLSHDGGASFAPVAGTPPGMIAHHGVFDADGHTLYVTFANGPGPNGVTDGAVMALDMASGQWRDITPDRPGGARPPFGYAGVSAGARAGTLIVSTLNRWVGGDTIWRSTDGGAHWRDLGALSHHDSQAFPWVRAFTPGPWPMGWWMSDAKLNPFNPDEAIYGTGGGLWVSRHLTSTTRIDWHFAARDVEETAVLDIASPAGGAAHLVAAVGDIGGFRWTGMVASPPVPGGYFQPAGSSNRALDVAGRAPWVMVRLADGMKRDPAHLYLSLDNGASWHPAPAVPPPLAAQPVDSHHTGRIALDASGHALVWVSHEGEVWHSPDLGATWARAAAPSARQPIPLADRQAPGTFYLHDPSVGLLWASTDGGAHFRIVLNTMLPLDLDRSLPRAMPGRVGEVWLPTQQGLLRFTGLAGSTTISPAGARIASIDAASAVGFGKAAPGARDPAVYVWGRRAGVNGMFRSTDGGRTWARIDDDAHRFGGPVPGVQIIGDPRVFGLVYVTATGRGVMVGRPRR
jgi:xyloglucan-specific exo-beta-1,4-glucanase